MSFKVLANTHPKDRDYPNPERTFEINLRLSLLNGSFYNNLQFEFHQAWDNNNYVYMIDRKPNVPSGTNELRVQMGRHAATLFGDFPQIETRDENARAILNDWAKEAELEERLRHAAFIGSTGSVAIHVKALQQGKGGKLTSRSRVFVDVYSTEYLEAEFDPAQPDVLTGMTLKYKIKGKAARALGATVTEDNLNQWYWYQKIWDENSENHFIPWLVADEKEAIEAGKTFTPTRDDKRSVDHKLGFCPWVWTRTPGAATDDLDGPCAFEAGIEHAIQLDYQDSQIVAGIKYAMSPTAVFKVPSTAPTVGTNASASGAGMVKGPETTITIDAQGDVKYLEMDGNGFKEAREKSKELRTGLIEYVNGDRIDPKEITQGHQGSKTMAMINAPMLNYVKVLQKTYEATLKRVLFMFMKIATSKPVLVNDERVSLKMGNIKDLNVRWSEFYRLTSEEKSAESQAVKTLLDAGVLSRETAVNDLADTYGIDDVPAELDLIAANQAADDARAIALATAQAQVKVMDSID